MSKDQVKEKYLSSTTFYRLLEKKEIKLVVLLSFLRFFTFLGGVIIIWIGFTINISAGIISIVISAVLFLYLVKLFSDHLEKREFLSNLLYIATGLKRTNEIHTALFRRYNFLSSMNRLLLSFADECFTSPVLNEIKLNISGKSVSASVSVRKLGRLIQAFDTRNNMIMGVILNGLFLWDYQSIIRLERWKVEYKALFPVWLEMIGQVDAYISFGNYAFNNPDFVYPKESDNLNVFSAKNIGHQLIDESKRVCNDFSLGGKGSVCIISGANMTGKSTFLRTIAINYILGMTGAPVCVTEMSFKPGKLFTSMRTMDSLSDQNYFFRG